MTRTLHLRLAWKMQKATSQACTRKRPAQAASTSARNYFAASDLTASSVRATPFEGGVASPVCDGHPTDVPQLDPNDDVWLMFVRNRATKASVQASSGLRYRDYTFRSALARRHDSVDVNWSKTDSRARRNKRHQLFPFCRLRRKSGSICGVPLSPAASGPFIDGTLHLTWTGQRLPLSERDEGAGGMRAFDTLKRRSDRYSPVA